MAKYTAVTLVVTAVGALPLAGRARDLRGPRAWIALITAALLGRIATFRFWECDGYRP